MCSFCMFWFHCRSISKGNGHVSVQPLFREKGKAPSAAPKGSETGLKPLWNTFRLTISDSMLLRLQHHCFVLLFSCKKDVLFSMFWFHCRTFSKWQWPCSSSASFPTTLTPTTLRLLVMLDHTITTPGKLSDWSLGPHGKEVLASLFQIHFSHISDTFQTHFRFISELSTGSTLGEFNVPALAETPQVLWQFRKESGLYCQNAGFVSFLVTILI